MNYGIDADGQTKDPVQAPTAPDTGRPVSMFILAVALIIAAASANKARAADSFFDIFVDLWDSGGVVMSPVDSGAFPFPPPPLNFPDLGAAGTIDIEMVSLNLRSSQPMVVEPPQTGGEFFVDSFFDIEYEINIDDGTGPAVPVIDSFFDIAYRIEVIPGRPGMLPTGEEFEPFDIEIVSMDLSNSQPISLPGGGTADLAIQLVEGSAAGLDGHVTVLKLAGGGGGTFQVDSFFDIFVEVSLNGSPPTQSSQDSPLRLANSTVIPTPSGFGMLAAGLIATLFAANRRRGH